MTPPTLLTRDATMPSPILPAETPPLGQGLITVNEAALRYRVTRQTVYLWIRHGAIPIVRVGPAGTIRIYAPQADALLLRPEPPPRS